MTTTATVIFRSLFSHELACTRCGSDNVFPAPGPFGAVATVVGFARHLCRPCGRPFWAKASAEYTNTGEAEPEDLGELLATEPETPAEQTAFDFVVSQPAPEPVDLIALDAEFARRCAGAKQPRSRRRRRRRAAAQA